MASVDHVLARNTPDAKLQFAKATLDMAHERLALGGEANRTSLSREQRYPKRFLQPTHDVADGARGKVQVSRGSTEGAGAGGSLEGAQGR